MVSADIRSDSFVCKRSSATCCKDETTSCMNAATPMPVTIAGSHSVRCPTRKLSTNARVSAGTAMPGITSSRPASTANASPARVRPSLLSRAAVRPGRLPPGWKPGPFSNPMTIPVNDSENSSSLTTRGPAAGSLR